MIGIDECPRCKSARTSEIEQDITPFYAKKLRVCGDCGAAWEPFEEADLLDEGEPYSSFVEPCDNCAFRPGSNEQQDADYWKNLIEQLGWPSDFPHSGEFYCHKGVPFDIDVENSQVGFDYPKREDGQYDRTRMRYCRGYLKMLNAKRMVKNRG